MTKTADEIKKALAICSYSFGIYECEKCPYSNGKGGCVNEFGSKDDLVADALEYIERLETENAKLKARNA